LPELAVGVREDDCHFVCACRVRGRGVRGERLDAGFIGALS
jgi:hypothetical protein